jgi:carbonic anhydrase
MCQCCAVASSHCTAIERRAVFKLAAAATAGLAFFPPAFAQPAKAPPKPENVLSPDAALDRLMAGNARYVGGVTKRHDFGSPGISPAMRSSPASNMRFRYSTRR